MNYFYKNKDLLLEELRKGIDRIEFNPNYVSIIRVAMVEFLYALNTKEDNPHIERLSTISGEQIIRMFQDVNKFAGLDFYGCIKLVNYIRKTVKKFPSQDILQYAVSNLQV